MRPDKTRRQLLQTTAVVLAGALAWRFAGPAFAEPMAADGAVHHTDADWRRLLTPAQYDVLRQEGTEMPFSSPLNHFYAKGTYHCAGCALPVFASATKFDSGTGWPSFWDRLPGGVAERQDGSMGMQRTEVHCSRCESHLGHVFDDGPRPTGLRYCMNGVAMGFTPASGAQTSTTNASQEIQR